MPSALDDHSACQITQTAVRTHGGVTHFAGGRQPATLTVIKAPWWSWRSLSAQKTNVRWHSSATSQTSRARRYLCLSLEDSDAGLGGAGLRSGSTRQGWDWTLPISWRVRSSGPKEPDVVGAGLCSGRNPGRPPEPSLTSAFGAHLEEGDAAAVSAPASANLPRLRVPFGQAPFG